MRTDRIVQERRLEDVRTYKRFKDGRLFVASPVGADTNSVIIQTRGGTRRRRIGRVKLLAEFYEVVRCRCGVHHSKGHVHWRSR